MFMHFMLIHISLKNIVDFLLTIAMTISIWNFPVEFLRSWQGTCFHTKISPYQYRASHCGGKTFVKSYYLHNGISRAGKMICSYQIGAQGFCDYDTTHLAHGSTRQKVQNTKDTPSKCSKCRCCRPWSTGEAKNNRCSKFTSVYIMSRSGTM